VCSSDLGENVGYAVFLCDMAASAGALSVLVIRDPYFQKEHPSFGEYRALPLINTEKLLRFVNTLELPDSHDLIESQLPFAMETLDKPYAVLSIAHVLTSGSPPTCPDFVLHSEEVQSSGAYPITIGDEKQVSCPPFYLFVSPPVTSTRAGGHHEALLLYPRDARAEAARSGRAHRLSQPQVAPGGPLGLTGSGALKLDVFRVDLLWPCLMGALALGWASGLAACLNS